MLHLLFDISVKENRYIGFIFYTNMQNYNIFLLLSCQQSSLPVHLHQWLSQKSQETPSTWSAASGAAPTARWVTWWPGPASHLRAARRSSNRRPPSRPPPLSSWTASTSVWGTRSEAGAAVVKHDLCWVGFTFKVKKKKEQNKSGPEVMRGYETVTTVLTSF